MKKNKLPKPAEDSINQVVKAGRITDMSSAENIFKQIKKSLVEAVLNSELDHELGYAKHDNRPKATPNRRNGAYPKTLIDQEGETYYSKPSLIYLGNDRLLSSHWRSNICIWDINTEDES